MRALHVMLVLAVAALAPACPHSLHNRFLKRTEFRCYPTLLSWYKICKILQTKDYGHFEHDYGNDDNVEDNYGGDSEEPGDEKEENEKETTTAAHASSTTSTVSSQHNSKSTRPATQQYSADVRSTENTPTKTQEMLVSASASPKGGSTAQIGTSATTYAQSTGLLVSTTKSATLTM
ncbi:uncharacterized protein LOC125943943 [Dermacentor silvarum]|uniref:uncharacterized protein LOC125943943 n=1 Tax=Dermacentor silvarum TaxID=543639 RepID=UPI00210152AE|nr:uncharacterized protein LOC125943943 [Dermacentor silvarum]